MSFKNFYYPLFSKTGGSRKAIYRSEIPSGVGKSLENSAFSFVRDLCSPISGHLSLLACLSSSLRVSEPVRSDSRIACTVQVAGTS